MPWFARVIAFALRPLYWLLLPRVTVTDPWRPSTSWVTWSSVSSGVKQDFGWYLSGETSVHPTSVPEVCDWLAGCVYATDEELFHEPDFWQHPTTLEHLRKGDCDDFAVWAWRKLLEIGIDARLFIGKRLPSDSTLHRHAWVSYESDGRRFLLEPTAVRETMIRSFDDAKATYLPYFSVGRDCKLISHEGYLVYLQERDLKSRRGRQAA